MRWHQKVKFFWLASAAAAYGVWRGALTSVLVVVGRVGGVFHPGTVLLLTTGIQHGSGVWQERDQRVTSEEKKSITRLWCLTLTTWWKKLYLSNNTCYEERRPHFLFLNNTHCQHQQQWRQSVKWPNLKIKCFKYKRQSCATTAPPPPPSSPLFVMLWNRWQTSVSGRRVTKQLWTLCRNENRLIYIYICLV